MKFDVVIVGGGHAGCEAASAAARLGASVALVTPGRDTIGTMSCNPAIGGLGKGHIVREIDALGGIMAESADAAAIQYRLLNRRKGPAVQGPRVQADRRLYRRAVQAAIDGLPAVQLVPARVDDLVTRGGRVSGVRIESGDVIESRAVVLATGTFLGGMMYTGNAMTSGGRLGELATTALAARLRALGLPVKRLKTGTPPRLDGRSIDWALVDWQHGDSAPAFMSRRARTVLNAQVACGITRTTTAAHDIIREHIDVSAVYGGRISSSGPRYCPSIEDKVMRFGDRDGHQVFLEPEGLASPLIYPNGVSTSLPAEVQLAFLRTMRGLEHVRIAQPGYAIEYDYIDPRSLTSSLELRASPGLFCAGQINGTTGYEEAAGQGLIAGVNAARRARGDAPVTLDRAESYIGVMIDDLVTQGISEPYRMFTSRAEYRLHLRADNADERLTETGAAWGIVAGSHLSEHRVRMKVLTAGRALLARLTATPAAVERAGVPVRQDGLVRSAFAWLRFPGLDWEAAVRLWPELGRVDEDLAAQLLTDARYAIYLDRQAAEIEAFRRDEHLRLPDDLAFATVGGLSNEMVERLARVQPASLGAAARIPGVTPAAISALLRHVRRAA